MFNLNLFVVAQMSFVLIDDAKIRWFLVTFQIISFFFSQKHWTKKPFLDKSAKFHRFLSKNSPNTILPDGVKIAEESHLATHGLTGGELTVHPEIALVEIGLLTGPGG